MKGVIFMVDEKIIEAKDAWKIIMNKLSDKQKEFHTVPKTNKKPVWFSAKSDGEVIYIDKAIINTPSSIISTIRKLNYNNLKDVYHLYIKREKGEKVSKEVTNTTRNQVYYFSLISNLVYVD